MCLKRQELLYVGVSTEAPVFCLTNISKNKIPSSQAKDGLTYDEISGEIDNSSAFSITYMVAKVKMLIWMKISIGLEQIMLNIILKYVLCCSLKSGIMESFKCRINFFSDEIFTEKVF